MFRHSLFTTTALFLFVATLVPSAWGEIRARSVILGMHARLELNKDVERISIGTPRVLDVELLSNRELLALG